LMKRGEELYPDLNIPYYVFPRSVVLCLDLNHQLDCCQIKGLFVRDGETYNLK
jgi:hypothetical protein